MHKEVTIKLPDGLILMGEVSTLARPKAWVIFVHGSGSSRKSPRNTWVAQMLNGFGFGTFLFDLLTEREDLFVKNRFNISLLSDRLVSVTRWFLRTADYKGEPIAFFGASTGAAAALKALGQTDPDLPIYTIISRGGRPDLSGNLALTSVRVPVLLLVGGKDWDVIQLNRRVMSNLRSAELVIVPGAGHLFEESGALEEVVRRTSGWLLRHLPEQNDGIRPAI